MRDTATFLPSNSFALAVPAGLTRENSGARYSIASAFIGSELAIAVPAGPTDGV